ELRGGHGSRLDRGADVRARRGRGDAVLRLGRRGLGGHERALRQGPFAGGGADAQRDHAGSGVRDSRRTGRGRAAQGRRAPRLSRYHHPGDPRRVRPGVRPEPRCERPRLSVKPFVWVLAAALSAYACHFAVLYGTPIDRALPFVAIVVTMVAAASSAEL